MALTQWVTMWKIGLLNSIIVLGIACFLITGADCKRSACWRYGHVCWGGHGKRSGQPPLAPLSGSMETDADGTPTGLYLPSSQWNLPELNDLQKLQFQAIPFMTNGIPPMKVQQFSPALLMLQPRLPLKQNGHSHYQLNSVLLAPKQVLDRHGMPPRYGFPAGVLTTPTVHAHVDETNSDDLVIPGREFEENDDLLTNANARFYSQVLKRAGHDLRGTVGTGGTEEPLVTSANGQDVSGSVATFFRDRKSLVKPASESFGKERFSTAASPSHGHSGKQVKLSDKSRRLQSTSIYDMLPLAQFGIARGDTLPKRMLNY